MRKAIRGIKKRRGRPKTTGIGTQVGVRWQTGELTAIDAWAKQNAATRSEAIRRLVELGLATVPMKQRSPHAAAKASEMATEQVEKLMSPLLPEQEQRARKRRLIKGPREFRQMRGDLPKPKR